MSQFLKYSLFIIIFLLSSCYEVSDDDLFEEFESNVIIEAKITSKAPPYYVQLSRTVEPTDSILINPIREARVIVIDGNGKSELLNMVQPGLYEIDSIQGEPNMEYDLLVNVNEENFRAVETMKKPPEIHRVEVIYLDEFVKNKGHFIKMYIDKMPNEVNYYKLEVKKNGELFNDYSDLIVFNDAFSENVFEYLIPYSFTRGDSVIVDLHVISETMHKYYYELSKQTNNAFNNIQPPMQNPTSNFNSNALGYFQVSAVTQKTVIIQ